MLLFVAIVLGIILRGMTPEDRIRAGRAVLAWLRVGWDIITKPPSGGEGFHRALRARTRWALITPSLAISFVVVFAAMLLRAGPLSDPGTLVAWGGSIGPRTTNGEWWRVVTSLFVHVSFLHLIAELAGLVQVGLVVERLVGPRAFAVVLVASGLVTGVWNLTTQPLTIHTGAAGAIFGIYGLLAASLTWCLVQRAALAVPWVVLRGLLPGIVLFLAYDSLAQGFVNDGMKAGLLVGFTSGLLVAARIASDTPPPRRVWAAAAATLSIIVALAAPLRGLADVQGVILRLRADEQRTSKTYGEAVQRFRSGRLKADDLADLADQIGSELHTVQADVEGLRNVPIEQQALVSRALEYLRLRQDSWRLRAEGLRAGRLATLQQADVAEQKAHNALDRASPANGDRR